MGITSENDLGVILNSILSVKFFKIKNQTHCKIEQSLDLPHCSLVQCNVEVKSTFVNWACPPHGRSLEITSAQSFIRKFCI